MADFVSFKRTGMAEALATLQQLPAEVVSKRGGPVKASLAKGARKLRDYAQDNLKRVTDGTGLLEENVVAKRGKVASGEKYIVTTRRKSYVGRPKGGEATTRKTAQILEYGSVKQAAEPWLRPAGQQHAGEIIDLVTSDLTARVDRIVKKLAKG